LNFNSLANLINGGWFALGRADRGERIFVSYRREDTRGDAGRLTDNLKAQFGGKQIFRDVETIEAGMDFVDAINKAVGSSAALLAVIGPMWLKVTDRDGRRRIDDPNDFVRLEIAAALSRNIRVIPVLVGGATMPKAEELPAPLESFARRQAHELSDARWDYDVSQLIDTLQRLGVRPLNKPNPGPTRFRNSGIAMGAGAAILIIAGYLYSEYEEDIDELFAPSHTTPAVSGSRIDAGLTSPAKLASAPNEPARPPQGVSDRRAPIQQAPTQSSSAAPARRTVSYRGFDAIGQVPTVVQVFKPG
jgi:hypothetical protein